MPGEIDRTSAIVLDVRPWSKTSHIVTLLAPRGVLSVVAKGAERPKSAFLGQYDLHYTCEVLYYVRGQIHPLREVAPLVLRENLRTRWRENLLAGYAAGFCAMLAGSYSPVDDEDSMAWYDWHEKLLDSLSGGVRPLASPEESLAKMLEIEMAVLNLAGWAPNLPAGPREGEYAQLELAPGRTLRISPDTHALLSSSGNAFNPDGCGLPTIQAALRFTGFLLKWHLDFSRRIRRDLIAKLLDRIAVPA